jgi:hypothetical protein
MAADANRLAAALDYLERIKRQAVDFGGGVASSLADRARDVGGLAYEAFTSDPNIGRMTTAEFADAAAARAPTPRLDAAGQGAVELGQAVLTQPVQTGKALVQGEVDRARQAMTSPRAAGEYAGSMVDPLRLASALRRGPMLELDVYHGTPHRFPGTETNRLGEFDASKIGTGEGAQAFGHGIYLAESPDVAKNYRQVPDFDDSGLGGYSMPEKMKQEIIKLSDEADKAKNWETEAGYGAARVYDELLAGDFGDPAKLNQMIEKWYWNQPERLAEAREAVEKAKKIESQYRGSLYKADLPDEMVDRMLDYDLPINQQNPYVLAALDRAGINTQSTALAGPMAQGQEKHLTQFGIPGIKYLDAGSRGQGGSGTRNFVVFPGEEKKVKILKRE